MGMTIILSIILIISILLYFYANINEMKLYVEYLTIRIKFSHYLIRYNKLYLFNESGFFYKLEIKDFARPIYLLYKSFRYFGKSNVLSESDNVFSFVLLTQVKDSVSKNGYKVIAHYYELNNFSTYEMKSFMNKLDNDYKRLHNLQYNTKKDILLNLNF